MKVLITGGAGFPGSHLGDALLREGNNVGCVDNLLTGLATNLRHLRNEPRGGIEALQHGLNPKTLSAGMLVKLFEQKIEFA